MPSSPVENSRPIRQSMTYVSTDCRFSTQSANVLHLSVKPQDIVDEEENAKTGKGSARGDGERTAGCRCVIL